MTRTFSNEQNNIISIDSQISAPLVVICVFGTWSTGCSPKIYRLFSSIWKQKRPRMNRKQMWKQNKINFNRFDAITENMEKLIKSTSQKNRKKIFQTSFFFLHKKTTSSYFWFWNVSTQISGVINQIECFFSFFLVCRKASFGKHTNKLLKFNYIV